MKSKSYSIFIIFLSMIVFSCNKTKIELQEQSNMEKSNEVLKKMTDITNLHTQKLNDKIVELKSRNARLSAEQQNEFIDGAVHNYCNQLIELEPQSVFNDNFQWNAPFEDFGSGPDVLETDPSAILPTTFTNVFQSLENRIVAIESNPMYDQEINFNDGMAQIQNALTQEIGSINSISNMHPLDKEAMTVALDGAKQLVAPQAAFLNSLVQASFALGNDPNVTWRQRTLFGKILRAVARVAIMVAVTAVVTAAVIKSAGALAPVGAKFALKIKGKTLANLAFKGVKYKGTTPLAGGGTASITGGFSLPGALITGGIMGAISAVQKFNSELPSNGNYWNEIKFYAKAKP